MHPNRLAGTGSSTAAAASTAEATGPEGCPITVPPQPGFDAVDKRIYPVEEWDALFEAIDAEDKNGDGYLCWKQYKPNTGQDKYWGASDYVVLLAIDNRAAGQLP
jgi:hypothetical protein